MNLEIADLFVDFGVFILCWIATVVFLLNGMYLEAGVFLIASKMFEFKEEK